MPDDMVDAHIRGVSNALAAGWPFHIARSRVMRLREKKSSAGVAGSLIQT